MHIYIYIKPWNIGTKVQQTLKITDIKVFQITFLLLELNRTLGTCSFGTLNKMFCWNIKTLSLES